MILSFRWLGYLVLLTVCLGGMFAIERVNNRDSWPQLGFDAAPNGPSVEPSSIKFTGKSALITPARSGDRFRVRFTPGNGKPSAVFSFKGLDLSDRLGLAVDINNLGHQMVRVFGQLNDNIWVAGYVLAQPGGDCTLYILLKRDRFSPSYLESYFKGMNGIPWNQMKLWPEAIIDPSSVNQLKVFLVSPSQEVELQVEHIRAFGSSKPADESVLSSEFSPFVDRYGQCKYKEWPGKVHSDEDIRAGAETEERDLSRYTAPAGLDQYGGWVSGPRLRASGHFRVEKHEGKWWLVDPEGRLFWSNGIDCVRFDESTKVEGRERYFEFPAPSGNFLARNLKIKYGNEWRSAAAELVHRRLRSWGINTIGAWSDREIFLKRRTPYTVIFDSPADIEPESEAWIGDFRRQFTEARSWMNDDPWCLGFFVGNEMHQSKDPHWWELYYRRVGALAKETLPNKLYLGSRLDFHEFPDSPAQQVEIVRHAAMYCDIVSFNLYRYTLEDFHLPNGIDRPAIIGEFHFGGLDRDPLHTKLRSVVNQTQRTETYRYYLTTALKNPAIVGAHWFQLYDQPSTGRYDGENYQIGFLDICDLPYPETVSSSREIGRKLFTIRREK